MVNFKDFALAAVLFLAEFSRGAFFLTFLPLYTTEILGWSLASAGLATSAQYLAETLAKSIAGWQLDRRGGAILKGGLLLGLLSMAAAGIYPRPALLVICSCLFGLGYSPLWIGVITRVAPAGHKDRSFRIGLVFAAWLAGMGSGLAVINFFISLGYYPALEVILACFLAALALAWIFYPRAPAGGAAGAHYPPVLPQIRRMAENSAVTRVLLPGMFLQTLSASLLLPVLPVFTATRLGLSHNGYGLLILAGGAAAVALIIPMGRLADRISMRALLFTGFAFSSAALAALALVGNRENALIITIILGASYAVVLPAWNTLLSRIIPTGAQATGWGIFSTIEGLGIALGPALGGLLARSLSPAPVLLASSVMLTAMALFYLACPVERFFSPR